MKKTIIKIISIDAVIILITLLYIIPMKFPGIIHRKHEYMGYTYYSSIFNSNFSEYEAEYAFDSLIGNEPGYKYLLDSFYKDGYRIYFDDKLTYAWCTGKPVGSNNFSACVRYKRGSYNILAGMFVNYQNDYFSEKIFFHELSHYVDLKLGGVSQSKEFKEIYEKEYESSTLAGHTYYQDIMEYYAEESAYYILYNSMDKELYNPYGKYSDAPKTFDYIGKQLEKLK